MILISYANDKKDLRQLKDVHNVIQSLKDPIIEKLSLSHNPSHLKIIKSLYHDIIKEKVFLEELSRIYNNILSNKFDNDNIDNNSNELILIIILILDEKHLKGNAMMQCKLSNRYQR